MRRSRHLRLLLIGVTGALLLLGLAPVGASSANISHSYSSEAPIKNGSLVSLDQTKTSYVESANVSNGQRLLGIAVASNDSILAVDAKTGSVQVATSGTANALVTTLNGNISVGDQIAVSPFNGLGMRAPPGSHVIGVAQTAFSSKLSSATTQQVTDKDGKQTSIVLGYVRLGIAVGIAAGEGTGKQLNSIQRLAKSLTGHEVSTVRVVVSLLVALVAIISLITLIYASIYGSIISVGRNPLAKFAVFRTLSSVLAMAVLTGGIASVTIFLLLR